VAESGLKLGCRRARALEDPIDVALSADGRDVYVTGFGSGAVSVFGRVR
jgi:DNA-binding beta-propeller fold protein YncE